MLSDFHSLTQGAIRDSDHIGVAISVGETGRTKVWRYIIEDKEERTAYFSIPIQPGNVYSRCCEAVLL